MKTPIFNRAKTRKHTRLPNEPYTDGTYFVTIVTHKREYLFGAGENKAVILNDHGRIALSCAHELSNHFPHVTVDSLVVMPNHVHMILDVQKKLSGIWEHSETGSAKVLNVGSARACLGTTKVRDFQQSIPGSLSVIVGAYKSAVTKQINAADQVVDRKIWQSGFHDHRIRDQIEWQRYRKYIRDNPKKSPL